jgi:large-conductance mechanosensitive channel
LLLISTKYIRITVHIPEFLKGIESTMFLSLQKPWAVMELIDYLESLCDFLEVVLLAFICFMIMNLVYELMASQHKAIPLAETPLKLTFFS